MWKDKAMSMWREGKSWAQMVDRLRPCFPSKADAQIREVIRNYVRETPEYKEKNRQERQGSVEYRQDGTVTHDRLIEICEGEEMTPEVIIKAHGLDPARWTVVTYRNNYWHSQIKGGQRMVMYQSRLTVKPSDNITLDAIDKHFRELDRAAKPIPINYTHKPDGLIAEVNIADLHVGKLCWRGDTGNNYDYKIARQVYYNILGEIANQLKTMSIAKIVFVWSHDFFNSDTITKTTTGGTPQDTDVRWQKLFDVGVEMLVNGIMTLREIAPVETFYLPSNHDMVTAYHAVKYLEAFYRQDKAVKVDTNPKSRKYNLYGVTLVGYDHGDKAKPAKLAAMMPVEVPDLWAQSIYREYHTAHLHSEHAINESNGVIVRRISSPTAADTWHFDHCYIGAVRKAQTFIYDPKRGLVQIINTPVTGAG